MRTSFHYQPEAQHPNSSAIHKLPADYPIFWHETDVLCVPTNVCSWGESGRAAYIAAMTESDPGCVKTHRWI